MDENVLKQFTVVNCTEHDIKFVDPNYFKYSGLTPRIILTVPPCGQVARVEYQTELLEKVIINNVVVDITQTRYKSRVLGLPAPKPGVIYVVSKLVAEAVAETRNDVYILSGYVRVGGKVLGGRSLAKLIPMER